MPPIFISGESMALTFGWRIEREVTPTIQYKVITAQFGDGYKQTSSDGINNTEESWSIKTHATTSVAKEIKAFFDYHKGVKSFYWTPPLGELGLYTCDDPSYIPLSTKLYSISGTFVRSYSSLSEA